MIYTTIRVSVGTKRLLNNIKDHKRQSYDEAIRSLITDLAKEHREKMESPTKDEEVNSQ